METKKAASNPRFKLICKKTKKIGTKLIQIKKNTNLLDTKIRITDSKARNIFKRVLFCMTYSFEQRQYVQLVLIPDPEGHSQP